MSRIIIAIAILISFTSCFKERIELDYNTDENKKVVINAWINTFDDPQFITVSKTTNYLGAEAPELLSNAEVTLKDTNMTYTLEEGTKGHYFLPIDWLPQIGDTYELKVSVEGNTYTAEHQLRPCPEIQDLTPFPMEEEDELVYYGLSFGFQEIPGEGDGYFGVDYLKGNLDKDTLSYGGFTNDQIGDGVYFGDIVLTNEGYMLGDTAVLDIHSIGIETSNYLTDIQLEVFRGSPFDPPPANVRTNIEGGAIGYFIMSDARRKEIVVE